MVSNPFAFQYLHSSRSSIRQTFTYRTDLTPRPLDSSFTLQFRTPQFHNRILCLTALYPRANASKPQIYNTSTTNQRHFLHIVALNFATIFFFHLICATHPSLPFPGLQRSRPPATTYQVAEDSLQVSVGRRAPGAARAHQRHSHKHSKKKRTARISKIYIYKYTGA